MMAFGLMLWGGGAATGQSDCHARARSVFGRLATARVAKEPEDAIRAAFQQAAQDLAECPSEEELWYLLLRSAELGGNPYAVKVQGIEIDDLKPAADAVYKLWPRSARVATIRARALGTVEAAREAAALDSSYSPAQVALGAALLEAKDAQGARQVLERVSELERIPRGYALLARARLETGDAEGAIAAALKEPGPRLTNPVEPGARDERPAREAREVMGLAQLATHRYDKAARILLGVAAEGSVSARTALEKADANLRRALLRLRESQRLSREERSVLTQILKSKADSSTSSPSARRVDEPGRTIAPNAVSRSEPIASGQRGF